MVFDFTQFCLDGRPGNEYFWISHKISRFWHPWHPWVCVHSDLKQIWAIPPAVFQQRSSSWSPYFNILILMITSCQYENSTTKHHLVYYSAENYPGKWPGNSRGVINGKAGKAAALPKFSDALTKSQPRGADYAHQLALPHPKFFRDYDPE